MSRVLFVLKYREQTWSNPGEGYGGYGGSGTYGGCDTGAPGGSGKGMSSGLLNSATFVCDMLNGLGVESKLVQVVDNNQIWKEVKEFSPSHVIIEAFWVVPPKFIELSKMFPHIKWIIRNHSEIPFLSNEGIALDWCCEYLNQPQVAVSNNAVRSQEEISYLAKVMHPEWSEHHLRHKVPYLPNYYPIARTFTGVKQFDCEKEWIDVSCFGAIRPLKNHLEQAVAAIKFATRSGYKLRFHINATRIEGRGDAILKNVRKLFEHMDAEQFVLVEHGWMEHAAFVHLCSRMDICLQVSFSETFNIVAADHVSVGVPVIGSKEIPWLPKPFHADPTNSDDIADKMAWAWYIYTSGDPQTISTVDHLRAYVRETAAVWYDHFA